MRNLVLCALVVVFEPALSQYLIPSSTFSFNVDFARFRNDNAKSYVEVYYSFYPNLLTFEKKEQEYLAFITILITIRDKSAGNEVVHQSFTLPVSIEDTSGSSFRQMFLSQSGYLLPFGEYDLEVRASDSLAESSRTALVTQSIVLKPFPIDFSISDLELCSKITDSQNKADLFYKNSLEVIPNPPRLFGSANHPVLFTYFELYNIAPGATYTIRSSVLDAYGKIVRTSSKQRKFSVTNAVEAFTNNITSAPSGKYAFRILVTDDSSREVARAEKTFHVFNPHLQTEEIPKQTLSASELAILSVDELDREFRLAQYVATDKDKATYIRLDTEQGKREFLAMFWAGVSKGTPLRVGITRAEYLGRAETANQRFKTFSKEGWLTDRGRVHILYGEPDEIERYPSPDFGKPYTIWHYLQIEGGVQFVFIDRFGFGDYAMIHSTKRGELHNEQWQENAQ